MSKKAITIEANVHADTEKVWEYWTSPLHIINWNYANEDWHCPAATNDLKVGGKYCARMEARDGSSGFDFESIYDIVEPGKTLAFTMTDGRKARTEFTERDGSVRVQTTFDADLTHPVKMQQDGWQAILDNFKKYVETN